MIQNEVHKVVPLFLMKSPTGDRPGESIEGFGFNHNTDHSRWRPSSLELDALGCGG